MPDNNNPNSGSSLVSNEQTNKWYEAIYKDLDSRKHPMPDDEKDAYANAYVQARSEGKNHQDAMNEGQKERTKKRKEKKEEEKKRKEEEEEREKENNRKANSEFYQASMPDDIGMSFPPKPSSSEIEAKETNISDESESQNISKKIYISLVYSICPKDEMLPKTEDYERIHKNINNGLDSFMLFPLCNFSDIEGTPSTPNADADDYIYIDCSSLNMKMFYMTVAKDEKMKSMLKKGLESVYNSYMKLTDYNPDACELYLTIAANEVILDLAYLSLYVILGKSKFSKYEKKLFHKSLIKYADELLIKFSFDSIRENNIFKLHYFCKIDWANTWMQLGQSSFLKKRPERLYDKISTGIHIVLGIAGALIPHPLIKAIVILVDLLYYEVETIVYWKIGDKRAAVDSFKGFEFSLVFILLPLPYKGIKKLIPSKKPLAQGAKEVAKQGTKEVAKEGTEVLAEESAKKGGKEGAEVLAEESAKKGGKEGAEELAEEGAKKGAKEGMGSTVGVVSKGKIYKLFTENSSEALTKMKGLIKNTKEALEKAKEELENLEKELQNSYAHLSNLEEIGEKNLKQLRKEYDELKNSLDVITDPNEKAIISNKILSKEQAISELEKDFIDVIEETEASIVKKDADRFILKETISNYENIIKLENKTMSIANLKKDSLNQLKQLGEKAKSKKDGLVEMVDTSKNNPIKQWDDLNIRPTNSKPNRFKDFLLMSIDYPKNIKDFANKNINYIPDHKLATTYTLSSLGLSYIETFMEKPYLFADLEKMTEVEMLQNGRQLAVFATTELFTEDIPNIWNCIKGFPKTIKNDVEDFGETLKLKLNLTLI